MSGNDDGKAHGCGARPCCYLPLTGLRKFRDDPIAWFTLALVVVSTLQWDVLSKTDESIRIQADTTKLELEEMKAASRQTAEVIKVMQGQLNAAESGQRPWIKPT